MKVWLGVIGRACIEFAIILALISFAAGAGQSVGLLSAGVRAIHKASTAAALGLTPLAALLTLFLAFFSFELRVRSRPAGWLGLLVLGSLLFSLGIGLRSMPQLRAVAASDEGSSLAPRLVAPGRAAQQGRSTLWIGAFDGGEAVDAVAADFASDYPRLSYSPRAELIAASGEVDIQGRLFRAVLPRPQAQELVPEASLYLGSWIWDRLAAQDSLFMAFATAGGFLLLALGCRFLCRITGWPLANALLAAAGLAGLVVLDAALSGGAFTSMAESLLRRLGLPPSALLKGPLLLALIEAFLGLVLGVADLAASPKTRRL
jgi:hypothetical protein